MRKRSEHNIKQTTLSLLDNVIFYWSTNIHMKLLLLVRDIREFLEGLRHELDFPISENGEEKYTQHLKIMAQCEFHIEISQEHKAKLVLGKDEICLV